jgi:hypothetical protein
MIHESSDITVSLSKTQIPFFSITCKPQIPDVLAKLYEGQANLTFPSGTTQSPSPAANDASVLLLQQLLECADASVCDRIQIGVLRER